MNVYDPDFPNPGPTQSPGTCEPGNPGGPDDPSNPPTAPGFTDVAADHTFAGEINWLAGEGITRGCNPPQNTLFCPDDPVTRGQMAAFLYRALR